MANVLEVIAGEELRFLQELADDLDGMYSCIAYAGKNEVDFILERRESLHTDYADKIDKILGRTEKLGESTFSQAVSYILQAYEQLWDLLHDEEARKEITLSEKRKEEIANEAEDILYSYLVFPEDYEEYDEKYG